MSFIKPFGIRQRFALGLTVVISGVMLVFSSVVILYNSRTIEKNLHQRLEKIATSSKESLSIALWQFNYDYAGEYINSLFHYEDLVFAGVISGGQVVAQKVRTPYQNFTFEHLRRLPDMIPAQATVVYEQQDIGKVLLVMSRERIDKLIIVSSTIAVLLLLFVNLAVFATNYILSRWYLFEPLSKLEATVSSIADGNLDTTIDLRRKDEIGHLASCVEKMMVNLRRITTSRDDLNQEIRERQKFENELQASLNEKEVLLKEIHHRVKNNMQIVQSLLNLQARKIGDARLNQAIQDSNNRIKSMALIHETLYLSDDLSQLNIEVYFNNLVSALYRVYSDPGKTIRWTIDVDKIRLDLDKSIACGLIINELVTNSMKHAFRGRQDGLIRICLMKPSDGVAELTVSDNGSGLPPDHRFDVEDTLGLQIVRMLAEDQLEGRLEIQREGGLGFKLSFPM